MKPLLLMTQKGVTYPNKMGHYGEYTIRRIQNT